MSTRTEPRSVRRPVDPGPRAYASVASKREAGRRRLRILLVVVVLVVLVAAAALVTVSPLLDVDHLQVHGVHRLTAAEVEAAGGIHRGDAMVWMDTGRVAGRIEALPYVRDARVTREWPDTVKVTVHERTPVAWIDGPGAKTLVDGSGRVLQTVAAAPAGMPQLLGTKVLPRPGGTIRPADGARVASGLTGLVAAGTASVAVTDHGVVLHLVAGPEIRMGEPGQVAVKLRAALAVLNASQNVPVSYIDVSVPTNPVAG
jgi:cell division protein FtsQ